jgi:hypothetical protein
MTDKEKIISEIQRRINLFRKDGKLGSDTEIALYGLINFINSMQEETVSEDLEEATKEWSENEDNVRGCDYISLVRVEEAFKAGANWQKDKLIKDAIEGYVDQLEFPDKTWIELSATPKDLKDGDEVKLIVLKEDKV